MSFEYLWRNRERPPIVSTRFLRVIAKRLFYFGSLSNILFRRFKFEFLGGHVGPLSIIGKICINGPASRICIGSRSFISSGVHFASHESIVIGDRVVINEGVVFLTASHSISDPSWRMFSKKIEVCDYAWIATNAIILPGVRVGVGAVVAAGAVVTADVADYAVVGGNPATVIKSRCSSLNYSPVDFCSPYEAWLGGNGKIHYD